MNCEAETLLSRARALPEDQRRLLLEELREFRAGLGIPMLERNPILEMREEERY